MLTELLQFSPLPPLRVRQLQEKLRSFTSRHSTVGAAAKSLPRPEAAEQTEKQRPAAVLLARAIAEKKKILCWNDHYEADGKWHHDRNLGGEERRLKLNPARSSRRTAGISCWAIWTARKRCGCSMCPA